MPSTLTHYTFLTLVEPNISKIGFIGAQGPDPFFFNFASLKKGKDSKKIEECGHFLHDINPIKTFLYFINKIKESKNNKEKKALYDYLKGITSHYALDATTHPFIFYNSGFVTSDKENAHDFFLSHAAIESSIDRLVSDKYNINKSPSKMLSFNKKDLKVVSNVFYNYLNDEFKLDFIKNKTFYIALKRMKFVYRIIYSKHSYKKSLFRKVANKSAINVFSTPTTKQVLPYDFLNLNHKTYTSCVDSNKKYNFDFYQLIDKAKDYYFVLLKEIDKLINDSTSNLSEVIDNVNHNGHKINEVMKHYDLIWNHKLSKYGTINYQNMEP